MSNEVNVIAETPEPEESRIVAGYRIGDEMGRGPLGKIYRAEDVQTGAKVVFRGFTRPDGADPEKWSAAKAQFRDLLRRQQAIDRHPVIQDIIAFGEENEIFWIATEYFEGRTLQQIMASEGAQSLAWCLDVMKQVADAVDYAAEKGFFHTDLTPYNILIVNHPENPNKIDVRVINFGLAHARPKYGSRYAAPEQHDGADGDRKSDVYAVGALLLELLTGKPIFTGATPDEIAQKARTEDPMTALVGRPSFVQNVIGAMLVKAPRFRYSSVGRAIDDLINKRSPDGTDRHDAVEMNTPELLAARRMERKQGQTAEEELSGAWREAENAARFNRLELGDDVPKANGAAVAKGRDMSQFAPDGSGRVALQDYRLSEMDVLEIKWKAERAAQRAEMERETARERWMPMAKWGILVAVLVALLGHAATIAPSYSSATVIATRGDVTRQPVPADKNAPDLPKPVTIKAGDTITKNDLPLYIVTGVDGSATFSLANGEAVYVPANSTLEVRELDFKSGAIRDFVVWNGRTAFRAQPGLSGKESFAVTTGEGVKTKLSGDCRAQVASGSLGTGVRVVMVSAVNHELSVEHPGGKTEVKQGNRLLLRVPGGQTLAQENVLDDPTLAEEQKAFAVVPQPLGVVRLLAAVEENAVLPIVEMVKGIIAIPASMNDTKNVGMAIASMQALCTLTQTGGGEGTPDSLDLLTLAPLSLGEEDRKRMLKNFDGGKLVSYRTLPNGGYEILARATDTKRTWIRGKNGGATTAGIGREPAK